LFEQLSCRLATAIAPVRISVFLAILLVIWLPFAAPIYGLVSDPNLVSIMTMLLLYAEFIVLVQLWGRLIYHQSAQLTRYGLVWTQQNGLELLKGLGIALLFLSSLFCLEGLLGWLDWHLNISTLPRVMVEGLGIGLGVGFVEELFFRGWLLDELQRDYRPAFAFGCNSFVYTLLHFIKPVAVLLRTWPEFAGLFLLGLIFIWAKRAGQGRLGFPIGLHVGLVWGYYLIKVGQLIQYNSSIPAWITGIDGNPLAGGMGLLFLGMLAWIIRRGKVG
jgi:membrane protease YdiL (CAAX protease family)